MKIDRVINFLQLAVTAGTLFFIIYTFKHQVIIPSRPIIKMTALAEHTDSGNTIVRLTNTGQSPVSNAVVKLIFVPFKANDPMEKEVFTVESKLGDLGAGESETVSFDLKFADKRLEVSEVFFVIMCIQDDELIEGAIYDIWYRHKLDHAWFPLRGNSAFVDDAQETAINVMAEKSIPVRQRPPSSWFLIDIDWMVFWTAVGAIGTILVAFLAIFKDHFRPQPKLILEPESLDGRPVLMGNVPGCYYHLKVTNLKPHIPAANTKLFCTAIRLFGATPCERKFQPPGQFVWAPAEIPEISPSISSIPRIVDFLRFTSVHAEPVLFVYPNTNEHVIQYGEDAELDLELAADNLPVSLKYKVRLTWNAKKTLKQFDPKLPCGHFTLNLISVK